MYKKNLENNVNEAFYIINFPNYKKYRMIDILYYDQGYRKKFLYQKFI